MNRFAKLLDLGPVSELRAALLRRTLCLFGLALIGVTWRLWTPQTVYPQVPLLAIARNVPGIVDWFLLAGIVSALVVGLLYQQSRIVWRRALVALAAMLAAMMILDQHRIQPWAYQLLGLSLVLAWSDNRTALRLARWWIVGLYFHSSISKFDYSFLHTVGQQFLQVLRNSGFRLLLLVPKSAAWIFPIGELAIAIGLCLPRLRWCAVVGALAMHLLLLVVLGPWGLQHQPGVLVWNLSFMTQVMILFTWFPARSVVEADGESPVVSGASPTRGRAMAAQWITWAAVLCPFFEPFGWIDQWPAWGLYAARGSRATVFAQGGDRKLLPASLVSLPAMGKDSAGWWLPIDLWSLQELRVPIYPDARFQLGVAERIAYRNGQRLPLRVVLWSPANRFTGERTHKELDGLDAIHKAAEGFWFNARPRNL